MFVSEKLEVRTYAPLQVVDLTPDLSRLVSSMAIEKNLVDAVVTVYSKERASGLRVAHEDLELMSDALPLLKHSYANQPEMFEGEGLSERGLSFLANIFLQNSVSLPIVNRELALGASQSLLYYDLVGPRNVNLPVMLVPAVSYSTER